jgi:hypothetical protein
MSDKCAWGSVFNDSDQYESTCDFHFSFLDGDCKENGFVFCPKCGKKIEEYSQEESE